MGEGRAGVNPAKAHIPNWFWHALLAVYILFVFSNSLTPAVKSSAESGFVLERICYLLDWAGLPSGWLTEHIVRKCAHFGEYAVMGVLLCRSMKCVRKNEVILRRIHGYAFFFVPFCDETLQLFTEGRSGQISDVWLDMSGAVCGALVFFLACRIWRHQKEEVNV